MNIPAFAFDTLSLLKNRPQDKRNQRHKLRRSFFVEQLEERRVMAVICLSASASDQDNDILAIEDLSSNRIVGTGLDTLRLDGFGILFDLIFR